MKLSQETQQQVEQLQVLEQSLQSTVAQKQNFQSQLLEIENALAEVQESKEQVYRVVGPLMIAASAADVKSDLESRKEVLSLRLDNLTKQEKKLKERFESLHKEVMKHLQPE
ncbi:MAG TPA: prefoldin subunit beta [Candidatus Nanoarchaeia archaeon]|nr:prefoldin subunit beta [Candidatus Nanoarchaeia archaeon]